LGGGREGVADLGRGAVGGFWLGRRGVAIVLWLLVCRGRVVGIVARRLLLLRDGYGSGSEPVEAAIGRGASSGIVARGVGGLLRE